MEWYKIFKITKNIFGHSLLHPLVIFCTIWITGVLVALCTNEFKAIGFDLTAMNLVYKWIYWLAIF